MVAPWTDPDRLEVERAAVFTFHARMAHRWRAGRVLPNPWVRVAGGPPVRLDDVIGYRWAFLGHGCDPRRVPGTDRPDAVHLTLGAAGPAPGCPALEDLDGLLRGEAGTVTAVRPDRFLLGVLRPG